MKSNLQKFQKIPLLLSIIFLSISCFIFFFLYKQIKNNDQTSDDMRMAWQTEAKRRNELASLDRALRQVEEQRIELDSHFILSSNAVPFLDMIEDLGKDVGAKAELASVDLTKDNSGIIVQANAVGNFASIYKFITLLENSPYETEFSSMTIRKISAGEGDNSSQWSASIGIKLLSFIK